MASHQSQSLINTLIYLSFEQNGEFKENVCDFQSWRRDWSQSGRSIEGSKFKASKLMPYKA